MLFAAKVAISALLIAGASELAKRSVWAGAILVSLPLTSVLALSALYIETRDIARVQSMSYGILLALVPSVVFFLALPLLLRFGLGFFTALLASAALTVGAYALYARVLSALNIQV